MKKTPKRSLSINDVEISKNGNNVVVQSRLKPIPADKVTIDGLGFDVTDEVHRAMKNAIQKRLKNIQFRVTVPNKFNVRLTTAGQSIICGNLDGQARCTTSGGRIKLGKISGLVHVTTSGGSLHLESAGDSIQMKTSGGSIRAGDIRGNANVATSGGSIDIGRVRGSVSAKTSGGSIRVADAGGAVVAVTSGGSISVAISQQPIADSYVATSGGRIKIALQKGIAFNLEHKGQGKVSGPFFKKSNGQTRNTKLNGGGPKLITKGNVRFVLLDQK